MARGDETPKGTRQLWLYNPQNLKHHITNAVTEGLNSKIQSIKAAARGFRSFRNYRIRILFFCGKLNLYPL
ncbi:MAG: hypothetical protein BWX48_03291 [Verrucomicrobia bacterium ADurb.Bin006]|nr:MAG: hypothetical protein BWX48_03291 [Verrucomicrobia bacterium ADurb.Bin006]